MTAGHHSKGVVEAGSGSGAEGRGTANRRRGTNPFPGKRKSRSAEQSFAGELKRLRGMSMEQRVIEALGMSERFSWIPPASSTT